MIKDELIKKIIARCGEENCIEYEPMKNHTTFRIGGPARLFVTPEDVSMLRDVLEFCKDNNIETFILGNGSNLLVSDKGFDGVVIQIYKKFNSINVLGNTVSAGAGTLLSEVSAQAYKHSLKGFEFASGIPGTIGGAVIMNAGAYGGEMRDVVSEVTVITKDNEVKTLHQEDFNFGYRRSSMMDNKDLIISVGLELQYGNKEEIKALRDELNQKRASKQPLQYPSAGSTFKRPEGNYAGKLIMDAGFRGYSVGGAQVSEKHCGFVINTGNATAADVIELTKRIKDKVYAENNIMLELEVKLLGDFD